MPSKACIICEAGAQYRCPKCKLRYCALACFKAHQAQCEQLQQTAASAAAASGQSQAHEQASSHAALGDAPEDEEELDQYRVKLSAKQLRRLRHSPDVVRSLRDERLRKLLDKIDTAPDREAALEEARMQNEHFRVFIDSMLQAVGFVEPATAAQLGGTEVPEGYTAYNFVG